MPEEIQHTESEVCTRVIHTSNPFTSMNIAVDNDCGLRSSASTAPDLDAGQSTTLHRGTDGEDGRITGIPGLQVAQKLKVICIGMVRPEPGLGWHCNGLVLATSDRWK